jgi:hypothetical protein
LLDHREDLVAERTRIQNRLRWLIHDRWPELELPKGCLDRLCWLERLQGRLARAPQDADVRVMRAQVRRLKELVREAAALEASCLCSCAASSQGCSPCPASDRSRPPS